MHSQDFAGANGTTSAEEPNGPETAQSTHAGTSTAIAAYTTAPFSSEARTKWLSENWHVAPSEQTIAYPAVTEEVNDRASPNETTPVRASSTRSHNLNGSQRVAERSGFMLVVRRHFLHAIMKALAEVQSHAESADAAPYVNKILHAIRDLDDRSPDDPALAVLWALYDALTYDSQWTRYSSDQFQHAQQLLLRIEQREELRAEHVERAIVDLSAAGFEILPFPLSFDEEDQLDDINVE